ncbi:MAG TPA: hypothetical protein VF450_17795 [Noviherbaspirillum sp.]
MKRQDIRDLKRAATHERDEYAMLALLERSVRFGHKRLALIRCIQAERLGIPLSQDILSYCHNVAKDLPVDALQKIVRQAALSGTVH